MEMIKIGPAGGNGGAIWDEKGRDKIAGILVFYGQGIVYSLQFIYYEGNGSLIKSDQHGVINRYSENNLCAVMFDYPSEFLTSVSGSFQRSPSLTYVRSINFCTNKGTGTSYGPFGAPSTSDNCDFNFAIGNPRSFGGFHGSQNARGVESIGFYVRPIPLVKGQTEED